MILLPPLKKSSGLNQERIQAPFTSQTSSKQICVDFNVRDDRGWTWLGLWTHILTKNNGFQLKRLIDLFLTNIN